MANIQMSNHLITASVYDRAGTIIARATNSYLKTHPLQKHFAKLAAEPHRIYLHAEIAALLKCGVKRPHKIRVERFKKDGTPGNAKPCRICELAIKSFGIKYVEYTV